jgi:hypothetical protein
MCHYDDDPVFIRRASSECAHDHEGVPAVQLIGGLVREDYRPPGRDRPRYSQSLQFAARKP